MAMGVNSGPLQLSTTDTQTVMRHMSQAGVTVWVGGI